MFLKSSARWCSALLLVALVLGCDKELSQPTVNPGFIPQGTWGGDSAGMIVDDTSAHFHVACTFGDVSGRIVVNSGGFFDVNGSYLLRAYPIAVGPSMPARFVGQISGLAVTLVVIVNDTVLHQTVTRGPVRVTLGQDPRLGPCPICASNNRRSAAMRRISQTTRDDARLDAAPIQDVVDHGFLGTYRRAKLGEDAGMQVAAAGLLERH
jgi:hypothetical protein